MRVQVNQYGLQLHGTHQLLIYADDVYIFGGRVHTIQKTEAIVVASKIGLEVSADKTYVFRQECRTKSRHID